MTQAEALRALGIKKFVGCTYFCDKKLNDIFSRYFKDAGFAVLGMEGMYTSPDEAGSLSTEAIYHHIDRAELNIRRELSAFAGARFRAIFTTHGDHYRNRT